MVGRLPKKGAGVVEHQGWQANNNSANAQALIVATLHQCSYEEIPSTTLMDREAALLQYSTPVYARDYRGDLRTIYQTPLLIDFFLLHPVKHPHGLIIKVKHQSVSGSVDEKLPYWVTSLKQTFLPSLFLLIGNGPKKQALAWLRAQQDDLFAVMTHLEELLDYANKGLL